MSPLNGESSGSASCLVCNGHLVEPFQESEVLVRRYVGLLEVFYKYLELEGDPGIIAKEFPFCEFCKIALVELKGLDVEIMALMRRASSLKYKFTGKIVESQSAQIDSGWDRMKWNSSTGQDKCDLGRPSREETIADLTFSESTLKEVARLRDSIFCRKIIFFSVV
ncbi:unnamed protein product [Allacma fusca]|uniref:Uncharacterized protein n=1 Tax=Allacma fusca TaxID=39272 RepID=A0A8J2KWQ6_9HEXA|nr:unnamed protein product [Allacma fusca]